MSKLKVYKCKDCFEFIQVIKHHKPPSKDNTFKQYFKKKEEKIVDMHKYLSVTGEK